MLCVKNTNKYITKYKTGTLVCNISKQYWNAHMQLHNLVNLGLKPIHILFTLYIDTFMTCLYSGCLSYVEWQKLQVVNSSRSPLSLTLYKTPPPASTTHVDEQYLHKSSLATVGELD
jgi:hypothetical protein